MKDKLRDMVRSILPSKARRGARKAKAMENRRVRRSVRYDLRRTSGEGDLFRDAYHRSMVHNRRAADKLNHFMRWCRAKTYGMSTRQALDYVRAILPKNLIGDHAYGHWESWLAYSRWAYPRDLQARRAQSAYDSARTRLARVLREDPHVLGELNAEIKSRKEPEQRRRLLHGMHDVDGFVYDVLNYDAYAIERDCLRTAIGKGGREAALQCFSAPYRSGRTLAAVPSTSVTMNRSSYEESAISGMLPPRARITSRVVLEWPTTTTVPPACLSRISLAISAA